MLLSQSALQLGSGAVAVIGPMLVVDPLVGVVAGGIFFGERIETGPAALAVRDRWPLLPVVASIASVCVYIGLGYAYGPIFVSVRSTFAA